MAHNTLKLEREQFRSKCVLLYNQGLTITEIAIKLGYNDADPRNSNAGRMRVHRAIREAREIWKTTLVESVTEMVNQKMSELDMVKREAFAAWERSKIEKVSLSEFKRKKLRPRGRVLTTNDSSTEVKTERRDGDPRFLDLYRKACMDQAEIEGLISRRAGEDTVKTPMLTVQFVSQPEQPPVSAPENPLPVQVEFIEQQTEPPAIAS